MSKQQSDGRKRNRRKHATAREQHLRIVKDEWKQVGKTLATGSTHGARADLRALASVIPAFVWAFLRAMYMTGIVLWRVSFSVMH